MSAKEERAFPLAGSAELVTEEVDGELLVYDRSTKEAHCLSSLAAAVFAAADGQTSVEGIAEVASARLGEPVDVSQVRQALAELSARDLMEVGDDPDGISRAELLAKGAVAAMALPLVTSVIAPAYGAITSPPPGSLSFAAAVFQCDDDIYWMKWNMDSTTGLPIVEEGNPECGGTMSLADCTMSPAPNQTGCLVGASVQEDTTTNEVTFTIPEGCKLVDFVLKCATVCVKPGTFGNAALPVGGASGPTYKTKGC